MIHIEKKKDQMVIAVPSKGRIKEHILSFLSTKGCAVKPPVGRQLQTTLEDNPSHLVVFMHARDIAIMLGKGVIDVGFTGLDLLLDTQVDVRPVVRLDSGKVKLALIVPNTDPAYHPFHLLHKCIATPFPNLTKAYFDRLKVEVNIQPIQGASEGIPYLGIADAIVDVVETGNSVIENGLKIIADDIFHSECIGAVNKPETQINYEIVNNFLRKIYL